MARPGEQPDTGNTLGVAGPDREQEEEEEEEEEEEQEEMVHKSH